MAWLPLPEGNNASETIRKLRAIDAEFFGSIYATDGVLGDLTISGSLTLGADGVFQTSSTDPRIRISSDAAGGDIEFLTGNAAEQTQGYISMTETDWGAQGDRLELELRSPLIANETTPGATWYGGLKFDVYTDDLTSISGLAQLAANGAGGHPAIARLFGSNTGTGLAGAYLGAVNTSSGDATTTIQAFSTSGTAKVVFDLDGTEVMTVTPAGVSVDEESWSAPSMSNSWVDYGSGFQTARYRKEHNGVVRIEGLIKSGTAGTVFTLPTGYRPASAMMFSARGNTGMHRLNVASTGVVSFTTYDTNYMTLNCEFAT
mgnify:CR=1 FL=1